MANEEKNKIEEKDIIEEMQEEISEIENEDGSINEEKIDEIDEVESEWKKDQIEEKHDEIDESCKEKLIKTMADYENFKKRVERDKQDMIFFLKSDIFKKILPRLDDLERIIKNTPQEMKDWVLFQWIVSLETKFKKDLDNLWIKSFLSIWDEVDPNKHDVMTTIPGKKEWIICDEFEKWYLLWDKVLRHAKVIVWAWE